MVTAALLEALPPELREGPYFVGWRYETRDGKLTKPPINPHTGKLASSTNPTDWSPYPLALAAVRLHSCDGIGRVVTVEQGLVGVDLDDCRNIITGSLTASAADIVRKLQSYTEVTPSGEGVRIWLRAVKSNGNCRTNGVEIYAANRYFTLTGNHLRGTPRTIESRQTELDALCAELFPEKGKPTAQGETADYSRWRAIPDNDLFRRMFASKKGASIKALWEGDTSAHGEDDSRADSALLCHLAFWTGKDPERMDSIFRRSGLMRGKWDSRRGASTYGADSIARAIDVTAEVWTPPVSRPADHVNVDDWPEPQGLEPELPEVDLFDERFLPACFRSLVVDTAERMQIPADFPAAATVVCLAGVVGRRASIRPKSFDHGWRVIPNLSGAIIGLPGRLKSPALNAVTLPLRHIEETWRTEFEEARARNEKEQEIYEIEVQSWREVYKASIKQGKEGQAKPFREVSTPTRKRLILTDATFESLHEILRDNPAGVLLIRDELIGWLSQLDKPGREGERAFYLQAWNGDSGFTIDRIGRGSVHVPFVCLSLFGNIQPGPLRYYLSEAREGSLGDDGLFQRFQILLWPDEPSTWTLVDRSPDNRAQAQAERVFTRLANLPMEESIDACFAPDAQQLFYKWWEKLEHKIRGNHTLSPCVTAHLSKYRSLLPSLALLFELADRAASDEPLPTKLTVSLAHTEQAAAYCAYLELHALRVYNAAVSPAVAAAHHLADHLTRRDLENTFSARDIYRKHWTGLDGTEEVRRALDYLESAGWVRQVDKAISPSGGRSSDIWNLNPKVVTHGK